MILEGIVSTRGPAGELHLAPMGPHFEPGCDWFELRPYPTSQTYRNLVAHPEGVLHAVQDSLLLAQAAIGRIDPPPATRPAERILGYILADACSAHEFAVREIDAGGERIRLRAERLVTHAGPAWYGWNRAAHAVIEAAILATRFDFLPLEGIAADYERLGTIVAKTGSPRERQAMQLLADRLAERRGQP